MKTIIDKILYYFGYAPIELKTIYKDVIISKEIHFDKLQIERVFNEIEYDPVNNKFYINQLKDELLQDVKKHVEWFVIKTEYPHTTKIMCRLYVNKMYDKL